MRIDSSSFRMRLEYDVTWSDRYAVHPCKIFLYGEGVPESGKTVPSNEWWLPHPAKGQAERVQFTHQAALDVLHLPGVPVTRACTLASCPWPKQLFLRDRVKVDRSESPHGTAPTIGLAAPTVLCGTRSNRST